MTRFVQFGAENKLRALFRTLGAITPASARPARDLPPASATFDNLLRQGIIREAAPGTFYLYEPRLARGRVVRAVLFWLVVVIAPIALIQFCEGRP